MAKFEDLPLEILQFIFSHLSFDEIKTVSTLSKSMKYLANERLCSFFIPSTAKLSNKVQCFKWSYNSIKHLDIEYPCEVAASQTFFRSVGYLVPLMTQLKTLIIDATGLTIALDSNYRHDMHFNDFIPTSMYCTRLVLGLRSLNPTRFCRATVELFKARFPKLQYLRISREVAHQFENDAILDLIRPSQIQKIEIYDSFPIPILEKRYVRKGDVMVETSTIKP